MTPSNKIIIRSVFKITKCFMEPAPDPKTKRWPSSVRDIDSFGNMILTEDDKKSNKIFIKTSDVFEIVDGKEFDLDDPYDAAVWEAIKFSKRIAQDRGEKDESGKFIIDGDPKKYGTAEFYVERPGVETNHKNSRKRLVNKATSYIYSDTPDGMHQKVRLLGNSMYGLPASDVEDFLVTIAEKDPDKIIDLYTGGDTHLRIFLLDAMDKKVIYKKDSIYYYSDILLGMSDTAVINWFKNPVNKTSFSLIKQEVYPELIGNPVKEEDDEITTKPTTKPTKK